MSEGIDVYLTGSISRKSEDLNLNYYYQRIRESEILVIIYYVYDSYSTSAASAQQRVLDTLSAFCARYKPYERLQLLLNRISLCIVIVKLLLLLKIN